MNDKSLTLKAGDTDPFGNKVSQVFATDSTNKYAIWEAVNGQVLCDTDKDDLANHPEITTWTVRIADLTSKRKDLLGKYNSQIANAYKICFDGNPTNAAKALQETYQQIVDLFRAERRSKIAYLVGALIVGAACESGWLWYKQMEMQNPAWASYDRVFAGLAVAVLGGFLSVATVLRGRSAGVADTFGMNVIYGGLRMVIAVIAGFAATLMIRTGVALSFLQQQDAYGGYLLACFLAGFSERVITHSLRGIEETA